jgi:hypothetical protein
VLEQVQRLDGKISKKEIHQAIRKVAEALEEGWSARMEAERHGMNLK